MRWTWVGMHTGMADSVAVARSGRLLGVSLGEYKMTKRGRQGATRRGEHKRGSGQSRE